MEKREKKSRKSIQEKIDAALAKKPTAASINAQITKLDFDIPENTQKFINERLVRNSKRKRFTNRPQIIPAVDINLETPIHNSMSYEIPTPSWFRTTEKVDVSVIIPLYKSQDVIIELIKSWKENPDLSVEIIFVEDNCPQNCKKVLLPAFEKRKKEFKKPIGKIICNKINSGYGMACNAGAQFATGDYLIFLNADTEVTNNWIKPMVDLLANDDKVGIIGNLQLKRGGTWNETIDSAGSEWIWGDDSFVHIGRHSYKKKTIANPMTVENAPKELLTVSEREMVTGCCFAIKADLFKYIGGFNPNYRIGYWEDSEICMTVRELGYKILFCPESIIYHRLGHTSSGGHRFFAHNKQYFMNKWVRSGRIHSLLIPPEVPKMKINNILVKRTSAHGDVLVASGVCAALKKKYPDTMICFTSGFPEITIKNPYIDAFLDPHRAKTSDFDVVYNLDLAYEWRPNVNILSAYAEFCGVKPQDCIVHLARQEFSDIILPDDFIIIHAGKTDWVGRDWPHNNFAELAQKLIENGENVVSVGNTEPIPGTIDLRNKTTIAQLAWVMSKAKFFIGIDSFPMHIAQVANIPGIAFFGCVSPDLRIYNKKISGITAENLDCLGCHHRKPAPSTVTKSCETGNEDCIKQVSVEQMFNVIKSKLNKNFIDLLA